MFFLIAIIIGAIGCSWCLLKISRDPPTIEAYKNGAFVRITKKGTKECDIEFIGNDDSRIFKPLHQDFPCEFIHLDPNKTYKMRFRSRGEFQPAKSSWSDEIRLIRKSKLFHAPPETIEKECEKLRKAIRDAEPCKILLLGKTGQGKSSFINTIFTAFHNKWTQKTFPCNDDKNVTFEQRDYPLVEDKVIISDAPGCNRNYNFRIFGEVFKGKRKVTTTALQTKENQQPQEDQSKTPSTENYGKINVALVIIGANESEELNKVNEKLYEELKENHIPYLTVVTKVDDKFDELANNFDQDSRVIQHCDKLSKHSGLVLPIINYTPDRTQRDTYIEYLALKILDTALMYSHTYY